MQPGFRESSAYLRVNTASYKLWIVSVTFAAAATGATADNHPPVATEGRPWQTGRVTSFDAAARAAENGTVEAASTVAAAGGGASSHLRVGAGSKGGGSVLGSTGQQAMDRRITYSAPSEDGTAASTSMAPPAARSSAAAGREAARGDASAPAAGGAPRPANRAQRRAARKRRR